MKALILAALAMGGLCVGARGADRVVIAPVIAPILIIAQIPPPQDYVTVWVEPVYQTVRERVYVPPVYETRLMELDGHLVQVRVLVREGYYTYVERVVCVSPGHWTSPPVVRPLPRPYPVDPPVVMYRGGGTVGVEGYGAGGGSGDGGKFSATYEWPK